MGLKSKNERDNKVNDDAKKKKPKENKFKMVEGEIKVKGIPVKSK